MREEESDLAFAEFGSGSNRLYPGDLLRAEHEPPTLGFEAWCSRLGGIDRVDPAAGSITA
jgi:hypothetical protein